MNTILFRIDPLSLAKIMGVLNAAIGLIIGAIISMVALLSALVGGREGGGLPFGGAETLLFGVGAIVTLPVMYGGLGFVGGLLSGFLYNVVTRWTGGIELEMRAKA